MRIGYARVSTADQNPHLQEDAVQKDGCEKIFRDIASGAVNSRRGLAEAIDYARDGDTLVVWKLDRLGKHGYDDQRLETDLPYIRRSRGIRKGTHPRADPGRIANCSSTRKKRWPSAKNGCPKNHDGLDAFGQPQRQCYRCLRDPACLQSNVISAP